MTKVCIFNKNYFHVDSKRFLPFQRQLVGLKLSEVLPQLKWTRKNITEHVRSGFLAAASKCQQSGMDIERTVVAGLDVHPNAAVYSKNLKLYGRGRYGATPHPKTTLVQFSFVQHEQSDSPVVPPQLRNVNSKGEKIRALLRERQLPHVPSIDAAIELYKSTRGQTKRIHS